jgi:hypothetical protein
MGFNIYDEGWGRCVSADFEVGEEQMKESKKEGR